ncbi:MAG: AAA family ATPase, partial [Erysipelotrichaceae bacterium]|nr:AAA family ATPase [Erysipelotrichaceae bacterium]
MDNLEQIIERCEEKEYIIKEEGRYYLSSDYYDELFISDFLKSFTGDMEADDILIEEGIKNAENSLKIAYDEKQKQAIRSFFLNNISIITGGPGTGKTTIIKTMSEIFKSVYPFSNLIIAAPTGRAAKRIAEICEVESKTIHSLLRWDKETNTFVFGVDNPILYDAIIIDEFSMVDN